MASEPKPQNKQKFMPEFHPEERATHVVIQ